ncbi:serine hydrolase domain-containing protein [Bradyrhizobium icense]|uniref:serine hydrolase domain-containing protein n=1 Tax=Bradyrhizobium icense TaxID=1274631 RepID=UPI0018D3995D|nr:serine hydrolase domain-containing protein [Bradyrhizobium icense]
MTDASVDCAPQPGVPWWSFTKTVLAAAALRLVAQGRLALDEPFDCRPFTLRQLLQHRAGVPDYGALPAYRAAVQNGEKPWNAMQLLDYAGADRLEFEPGHDWGYSNIGYYLVRRKIEDITGRNIGSALQHLVFDALGLASVHIAATAGDLAKTLWGNPGGYDPGWVYHGLLVGTASDAARFLHGLILGEVLPSHLLTEMKTFVAIGGPIQRRPWQIAGYGLGLMAGRMTAAGSALGHSGAGPGSVSAVYHFNDLRTPRTVAAFAQAEDESITEYEVERLALA